jgi:hypothetical protein
MARGTLGFAACKITGFAIGRGGYRYHNPVKVLPIDTISDQARGWISIVDNTWDGSEEIQVQGYLSYKVTFKPKTSGQVDDGNTHTYYFDIGTSILETAQNIATKMNNLEQATTSTLLLGDQIYATAENDTVHLIAVPCGSIGNTIWYKAVGDPFETPHAVPLNGGALMGGVDESFDGSLIDKVHEGNVDGVDAIAELANASALSVTIKIHPNSGLQFAIGEIALKAQITKSTFPNEVGTEFCFAKAHHPIEAVHDKAIWVKRFVIQV